MADAMLRAACLAIAPAGTRARLSTLIFHRVFSEPDPLQPGEVTCDDFERILLWVKRQFNVISMSDAVAGLKSGKLPARPLVITFDDGYADNHDLAAPILRRVGLPATFFVAAGYLDGGRMFNDTIAAAVAGCAMQELDLAELGLGRYSLVALAERRRALSRLLEQAKVLPVDQRTEVAESICRRAGVAPPAGLMMTSAQVAALKDDGFEIGGHTFMHPILARLAVAEARDEIQRGRRRLEEITGSVVRYFAYPNGRPGEDFNAQTVSLVRELKFEAAFTTTPGVATAKSDLFQLPRFTPWDRSQLKFGLRMLRNLANTNHMMVEATGTVAQPAVYA
jgi:peptidoglycan/xylan/chitin deacetylase (PgdA/CDA1 family)